MTLSKRSKIIIISVAAAVVLAGLIVMTVLLVARQKNTGESAVTFTQSEYVLENGGKVKANGADRYCSVGTRPYGVSISFDGTVTVGDGAADGAQMFVGAVKNDKVVATAIVTVRVEAATPTVAFDNLSSYIVSGEKVSATATPLCAVSYTLKNSVDGVSVDKVSGTVFFSYSVTDGTEFTVSATARGVTAEKTFKASIGDHVTADKSIAIVEAGVGGSVHITLDYGGDAETEEAGVLGVRLAGVLLDTEEFDYHEASKTVSIANSALKTLPTGENELNVYTARNTVSVTVKAAKYVKSAEDLAAIGDNATTLSGYYIMVRDVDLTEYLGRTEYGWMPVGIYQDHEVPDGTEEALAFRGTFDGNGHTVSGLWMNRSDDYAYNAGLFGYTANSAEIKNLRVVGSETMPIAVRSFSGVIAGANHGIIRNCVTEATVTPAAGVNMIGAFVGRNEGSIYDSYSLGGVAGEGANNVGAFVGENGKGEIVRSYAVSSDLGFVGGESLIQDGCAVFLSREAFISDADFSEWNGWIADGGLPTLPVTEVDFGVTSITVTNTETQCVAGDSITIEVTGEPEEMFSRGSLVFSILEGEGVTVTKDGVVNTAGATAERCTVLVSCDGLTATFSFDIIGQTEENE